MHKQTLCYTDDKVIKTRTPRIVSAEYMGGYRVRCWFEDGQEGIADLEGILWGPVFEPLKDISRFREFAVMKGLGALVWPGGVDVAGEKVRELCKSEND